MRELTEQQLIDGNERTIFQTINKGLSSIRFYLTSIELTINPECDVEYSIKLVAINGGYPITVSGKGTIYAYVLDPVDTNASLFDKVLYEVKKYILDRLWDIVGENRLLVEEGKIGVKFEYDVTTDGLSGWLI